MDDLAALYQLYRDRALDVRKVVDNFFIYFFITIMSIFVPITYTITDNFKDTKTIFIYFIIIIPIVFIPIYIFMIGKYREYKYKYATYLIKSIVNNNFSTSDDNPNFPSYHDVCKKIVHITDFDYNYAMTLLIEIYPPSENTDSVGNKP